jgi:serine/threonine protein kinase
MACCINPDCQNPINPDGTKFCLSCGEPLMLLLGGRYNILEPLGGGGFSRTYLAQDKHKLDEICVVKQLAPQVQGSSSLKKASELFEQEAQRLQQLGSHPQIPTLYAYLKQDDYLYLVQEYIEGQNLLQELKQQGIFTEVKIRELLCDLLPILEVVHQQQVIHRDIKPENIIHRHDGRFVLIDFGVAKQLTQTVVMKAGTVVGSYGYAAFEQINEGKVYPATDLYGLGATCFHLLTNVSPWYLWMNRGFAWTQGWKEHLKQPIGSELKHILDKLLQPRYEQRYQSAEEVLQDLNRQLPINQTIANTIISKPQPKQVTLITGNPQQFPTKELLTWAVIASSGSWLLAIALLSFSGTVWISSGLWLLILGGLIVVPSRPIFEKTYLFVIALITTLITLFISQRLLIINPLIQSGIKGLIVVGLLVIIAALLAFILARLSQLVNDLMS